jgi:hypothetical protein
MGADTGDEQRFSPDDGPLSRGRSLVRVMVLKEGGALTKHS